ncbi:DNA topoisomerase (ATP-hydrolyzing) subunit B [Bacillus luti]|nr:DNA gyrase subunit B [Bacillus cereus]
MDITTVKRVEEEYDADQIEVLEGLEAVRKRPGMYIGSTSFQGLHHLIKEIVDNSNDEYQAGFCNRIHVTTYKDGSLAVQDNGRGIPTGIQKKYNKPAVEVALTTLHAGGKFKGGKGAYKNSGGLHGVGASCVNALSEWMKTTIHQNGKVYEMNFSKGHKTSELTVVGTCPEEQTGTLIHFLPDDTIFLETTVFDYKWIYNYLQESAMLNRNLEIVFTDERQFDDNGEPLTVTFLYEDGIAQYVRHLNRTKHVLHEDVVSMMGEKDDVVVEISLQYTSSDSRDRIFSFANNINTPEGGKHEESFKRTLTNVMKEYIANSNLLKSKSKKDKSTDEKAKDEPNGDDIRTGLTAIISVKVLDPQFEGQTKNKLQNPEVTPIISEIVSENLRRYFDDNPDTTNAIIQKIVDAFEIRLAVKRTRENEKKKRSSFNNSRTLPAKLEDALSNVVAIKELYIVEGDSAGGAAKQGRDKETQAILPLKGKSLNTEKAEMQKILENKEISAIINAIGTGVLDQYIHENRRYDKVIIMTDADVDGSHITVLLLTFFYRYMRPLLENGCVYLACPPLYKIKHGKTSKYVYSNEEKEAYLATLGPKTKVSLQRYKGLGEMNPTQLWETTMDPEVRTLERQTLLDAAILDEMFSDLMGDDPQRRKEFVTQYGIEAEADI